MKSIKGITLISLVITVIIMIILATVTIININSKNSSVKKAQEAKLTAEEKNKRDTIEEVLVKFNAGNAINTSDLKQLLMDELDLQDSDIAKVYDLNGDEAYLIKNYLGTQAYISPVDGIYKIQKFGKGILELGMLDKLEDGDRLIAPKDGDELEIDKNNYAIISSEDLRDISFDIPADTTVKLKLLSDFTITNEGLKRAAINLNENSVLDLAVYGNVTVNSTFGENANETIPGKGGYAGIRVHETATLNLSGTGVITAIGGNAGKGGTSKNGGEKKCAGGGGAGAGIGGNGGNGGVFKTGKGASGEAGENCGTVNITGSLTVYAYGGAGGGGGAGTKGSGPTGGGAGGYPAAGIGGGRRRRRRRNLLRWWRRLYWRKWRRWYCLCRQW